MPLPYRIAFNWIEPFVATSGALQAYFAPHSLQQIETPSIPYHPRLQPLFTQRTGLWLLLAFNDAVTLRATRDVRIWRLVLAAGLFSDIFYTLSILEERGAARFWNPAAWDVNDWTCLALTIPAMVVKLACVAGVGLKTSKPSMKDS
ncbi:hypothetical protein P152DRAFT_388585 [Eremomyces bilateralis CBS 781.70]|uniref:DUF7704 domain-containing protein n=1 Tax=Eremomyces bilateralis CBS 781.70 TaxID=1392243 RepID=A0A6G1GF70_9PEZI|nr:uncharacterized protein P152DRAFT_388585 [Eremomyces bilateralis CBS 781.70]KAF1816566.1 hypothetical protein P152DRAFT_388585 [Eremomyces bilateralis CBS 781.70]